MTRDTRDLFDDRTDRGRFGDNETVRGNDSVRSDLDLSMILHVDMDRPKSVLVSSNGDRAKAVWLPRSEIQILEVDQPKRKLRGLIDQPVKVTLPEWLAKEKGLI